MSEPTRYGYYLRPSPAMCAAQVRMHELLEHQYGLRVAGRFMPHATIKGFFRSEAPEEAIRASAAIIADGFEPFPVYSQGVADFGDRAIVLSICDLPDGSRNPQLQELHERTMDALLPLVSPDCPHSPGERIRDQFHAHLTLAMADIPKAHFTEISAFCRELEPIGPESFLAERLHLYAFDSDDWSGQWWHTFRWRLIDSWQLRC